MALAEIKYIIIIIIIIITAPSGAAGNACAEGLRQLGFTGRLVMVCGEPLLPYDRTKLSKNLSANPADIALRTHKFYEDCGVELQLGTSAVALDTAAKCVQLDNGEKIVYDKVFLATGGRPRTLQVPGSDLKGVHILRSPSDAAGILEGAKGAHVVVVGSSFIGDDIY